MRVILAAVLTRQAAGPAAAFSLYNSATPSAKGLAECVKKLEFLSFEDVALQL